MKIALLSMSLSNSPLFLSSTRTFLNKVHVDDTFYDVTYCRLNRRHEGVRQGFKVSAGKGFGELSQRKPPVETQRVENKEEDEDDKIPDAVFDRMILRVVLCVSVPMFSGILMLKILDILKTNSVWDVPIWMKMSIILVGFGTSALGIAYGTLSTSWDPEREGSLLGWEEAQRNWPMLWLEKDENGKKSL